MNIDTVERAQRPSIELERHAAAVCELGVKFGISNIRVFGSCVTGADDADSDINLIGVVAADRGYFHIGAFVGSVEELTGYPVDFVIDDEQRPTFLAEMECAAL